MATPPVTRPSIVPEAFNGEGSWKEWKYHFDNVAVINSWNDAAKLNWLKVRLTGKAQTAFQRLPAAKKATFALATEALKDRFEPASRKTRYQAELQTKRKKKDESWADFADELRALADKAYDDLEDKARERLALNAYLDQLDNPHVAFGVKQKAPKNLEDAVTATLELESYLPTKMSSTIATVEPASRGEAETSPAKATVDSVSPLDGSSKVASLLERLVERVEKLEASSKTEPTANSPGGKPNRRGYGRGRRGGFQRQPVTCWTCGQPGHVSRQCTVPIQPWQPSWVPPQYQQFPGNGGPPAQ